MIDTYALASAVGAYDLGSRSLLPLEPLGDGEWRAFLSRAIGLRAVGLLAVAVADGAFPVTDRQFEELCAAHQQGVTAALTLQRLLCQVAPRLEEANIPYRVLKGTAVAMTMYAEPSMRAFGDLDLLVRGDDFETATAILQGAGAVRPVAPLRPGFDRRFGKGAMLRMPDELEVDLHRTFVAGPLGLTIPLEELFEREAHFDLGGRSFPCLALEERCIHACFSVALEQQPRVSPMRDVAEFLLSGTVDHDRLLDLAHRWRCTAVVARAINLTWEHFALADVTRLSVWAARYEPMDAELDTLDAYLGGQRSYSRRAMAAIRVIPGIGAKVSYARSLLFPDRRHLATRHSGRLRHIAHGVGRLRRERA